MSFLRYSETMNTSVLQIWNNDAFDKGESEESAVFNKSSWSPQKPMFVNLSDSLNSLSSKENISPLFGKSSVSVKSPVTVKPLHPNGAIVEKLVSKNGNEQVIRDEKKIDAEIEEIEMEISRLSKRLEALLLEKAEQSVKTVEMKGRVVPAKFMDQKQSVKNSVGVSLGRPEIVAGAHRGVNLEPTEMITGVKFRQLGMGKPEIAPVQSSENRRKSIQRRGVSLGPPEIVAGARRDVSLGPSEIVIGAKSRHMGNPEITPVLQNRRKSCFWKLRDIDEEKETKERGKSLSLIPKTRKKISKLPGSRQAVTTVGSKKAVKKEDGVISTIQPKKLFKETEHSVLDKKPMKIGRIVASRYNQSTVQSTENSLMRKRSLPDDRKGFGTKDAYSVGKSSESVLEISQKRVKKRWEIPTKVAVHMNLMDNGTPESITEMSDMIPRISTCRSRNGSPDDSGEVK